MKIILYKDIPNLGEEGDVKNVADGYARNYLIPQKLAVQYTKATETELAQKQQSITRRKDEKAKDAASMKQKLEGLTVEMTVAAGEKGKLFGSVTSNAIVDYLMAQGIEVERKKVELPEGGIKVVGTHTARVKLYGGEVATVTVNVSATNGSSEESTPEVKAPVAEDRDVEVEEAGEADLTDDIESDADEDDDASGEEDEVTDEE